VTSPDTCDTKTHAAKKYIKPNEEQKDYPNYIEGIRPYNHSKMINLFFDATDGKLIVNEDDVATGGITVIIFSDETDEEEKERKKKCEEKKPSDVRYQLEIKKGEED